MTTGTVARIKHITPQFTVPDLIATCEYYRDVWGFTIEGYWADPPVFGIISRDGVRMFFNKAEPGTRPRTGRHEDGYDVYLDVQGLDAWVELLRAKGADIIDGPDLRVYGQRELVVRDLNGLIIAIGEEAPLRHRG